MTSGLLSIETKVGRGFYDREPLPLTRYWAYAYGLLALRVLEGGSREVRVEDIARLPSWTEVQRRSVASSLARHRTTMQAWGFEVITAPPGEQTKSINLDPERVTRVRGDVGHRALREWLGLTEAPDAPQRADSTEVSRLLVLAQTAFEQGRHREAERLAVDAAKMEPSMNQHIRSLALVAWVRTVNAPYDEGWGAVLTLQRQLRMYHE